MGIDTTGMSHVEASDAAIDAVVRLAKDCDIPDNFRSVDPDYPKSRIGVGWYEKRPRKIESDDEELLALAEHMMGDPCTAGNPRTLTVEDAVEILRDCVYSPMGRH